MLEQEYFQPFRELMPALQGTVYLNAGAIGPVSTPMYEEMDSLLRELYLKGADSDLRARQMAAKEEGRSAIARFIHADPSEIFLARCVADGLNAACAMIPVEPGDEYLLSTQENLSGVMSVFSAAAYRGCNVRKFAAEGGYDEILAAFKQAITPRTKVALFSHVLHTYGSRLPIREMCAYAREHGVYTVVDGAQALGNGPVDVKDLGCDFYAMCGQKWLGGYEGVSATYVNRDIRGDMLHPIVGNGAQQSVDFAAATVDYHATARRFEFGSMPLAMYSLFSTAVKQAEAIGPEHIFQRQLALHDYARQVISSELPEAKIWSHDDPRMKTGIITISLPGVDHEQVWKAAWDEARITFQLRNMDMYGHEPAFRFCLNWYVREQDIDQAVAFLKGKLHPELKERK